ncbi:hypothetical protein JCM10207_006507 [Rhodosporidiobolus poonsookiae]
MASVRLSAGLRALLAAPHAQGNPLPPPPAAAIRHAFNALSASAEHHGLREVTWLTLGTATLVTLNSPGGLTALYDHAAESRAGAGVEKKAEYAAVMREVGLKTISFSGIPRAINNLGALRAHLDEEVAARLSTDPTRQPTPETLQTTLSSASSLWTSIYDPHSQKLLTKLSTSHPDLPVHILTSHYGPLLSDPPSPLRRPAGHAKIGRILTSVVAIACLRAQGGVGPQVTSHVFGLLKAGKEELAEEEKVAGGEWLTSEEGARWVVEQVDRLVEAVTSGAGPTFATRAKL